MYNLVKKNFSESLQVEKVSVQLTVILFVR